MFFEAVEERGLIGVDHPSRAGDLDELDLVDFPRRAACDRTLRSLAREPMHALLRARVVDVTEIVERADVVDAGLFPGLSARSRFERLAWVGRAFRDPPRRAPVVVAGRM